jgi:hypothetical protein
MRANRGDSLEAANCVTGGFDEPDHMADAVGVTWAR